MRRRRAANLGSLTDVPTELAARQKLAVILVTINDAKHRPKRMIQRLEYPISEAVWLVAISCVRPEELAFKWVDLDAKNRMLWVVRAVNRGKLHTPKYHRSNFLIRLTRADVDRLLALKQRMKAMDEDWMFPNSRNTGPIRHEDLLSRRIQPVADELGLPHITWRLLRHWGATQMVEARVAIKAAQERLGRSRPDILLKFYAHVLDESADMAAETLSAQLGGTPLIKVKESPQAADYSGLIRELAALLAASREAGLRSRAKLLRGVGGAGRDRTDA